MKNEPQACAPKLVKSNASNSGKFLSSFFKLSPYCREEEVNAAATKQNIWCGLGRPKDNFTHNDDPIIW